MNVLADPRPIELLDGALNRAAMAEQRIPCTEEPDLWFSDRPAEIERAKQLCGTCPVRAECFAAALKRSEPWGVWGGELFEHGVVIARKRRRGRPPKTDKRRPAAADRLHADRVG